jgi:predicted transcriptional regulator
MAIKPKDSVLRVRCTGKFKRRLKALATIRESTSSALARDGLQQWLDAQEAQPGAKA